MGDNCTQSKLEVTTLTPFKIDAVLEYANLKSTNSRFAIQLLLGARSLSNMRVHRACNPLCAPLKACIAYGLDCIILETLAWHFINVLNAQACLTIF